MHIKRWLTAIVAIPVLIFLIGFSPRPIFYSVLCLFSLTGLNEYYRLSVPDLPMFVKLGTYLLVIVLFATLLSRQILLTMGILPFIALFPMICYLFSDPLKGESLSSDIAKALFGPFYVCLPMALLIPVDLYPAGRIIFSGYSLQGLWIFFLLAVIFAGDTGAFYSGKIFGKHKLYESVSPKKTWEGAVGGLIFSVFTGFIFLKLIPFHPAGPGIMAAVFVIAAAGQIGDLAESMLKRNHNVKDSGALLPGHGGILDRIDSLLFAIPVLYIYLQMAIR